MGLLDQPALVAILACVFGVVMGYVICRYHHND